MNRYAKTFHQRRNDAGRSYKHHYTMAGIELRREFFMRPRDMRKGYNELRAKLYGPCSLMTSYLRWRLKGRLKK